MLGGSRRSRVLVFLFPPGKLEIFVDTQSGELARQEILSSRAATTVALKIP